MGAKRSFPNQPNGAEGTAAVRCQSNLRFSRPDGTYATRFGITTLKRRASVGCPFGTELCPLRFAPYPFALRPLITD